MSQSRFRGIPTEMLNGVSVFSDTKEPISKTFMHRACGHCNKHYTPEGHDGCLGTLVGVMNACCGHGATNEAYVQFWDRECVRGEDALIILDVLKRHIKEEPCTVNPDPKET